MFRWKWWPGKRDKRWLALIPVMTLTLITVLLVMSKAMLGLNVGMADIFIWGVMALIASVAVCGFFYAGLTIAGSACMIGVAAGIIFMAYVFAQPVEWKGIVGLVSGAQLAFLCFLVGINAQMVRYVVQKRGGKR